MIKGVIFDADGTLLDSMEIWMNVTPEYLKSKGKILPDYVQKQLFSMSIEEGAEFIHQEFSLTETPEQIKEEILNKISRFYTEEVQLKPGVFEYLNLLHKRNIPVCVASAGNKALIEAAFKRLGILSFFKIILTCSELNVNKSVPDIFMKAAEILGTEPENTMIFEDSLIAIKTAKKSGFRTCGVSDIFSKPDSAKIQEISDIYIEDFSYFLKRFVIISAAEIKNYSKIRRILNSQTDFYTFCDGGLNHQKKLKIKPDLIVGDFDSARKPDTKCETISLPREKDDTDTFFALKEGLKRGFTDFLFIGALGNRFDHSLCNVSALLFAYNQNCSAKIVDDYSEIQIAGKETLYIQDNYAYFSLMCVDGQASGISIRNAKYPLENGKLTSEYQYAISNEVIPGKTAEISVQDGKLLLIKVTK